MDRTRFKTTWNGIATIIFLAGLFLNSQILGFSSFGLAIFMWIIGGIVTDMIYGPKNEKENDRMMYPEKRKQQPNCLSCGAVAMVDAVFCQECGSSLEQPIK